MKKGMWYGVAAYAMWGLFPVYFKWLQHVSSFQVVGHRIVWSCAFLTLMVLGARQWRDFRAALTRKTLGIYSIAAALIAANWLIWVWAVNAGHIVDTSLGYFITPLLNVFLGVVFLHERLRRWQWMSIGLATVGVAYLTISHGSLPWIALSLAAAFACYGLVKKKAPLNSLQGLTLETMILFVPALLYLIAISRTDDSAFFGADHATDVLLIGGGLVTTIPLLLFASAARSIPLSGLGVLQYIAPTVQFLLGIWVYGEPFTTTQLIGFALVWVALAVFAIEGWYAHRTQPVLIE